MSSLIQTTARRAATMTTPLPIIRTAALAPRTATAAFTTSPTPNKSATETVKDSLKTVDRKVSDKIVDGINLGCTYQFMTFIFSHIKRHKR